MFWFHPMWFGGISWFVVIVLIIWAIVRISGNQSYRRNIDSPSETALDILKKRYAKGEITKSQFEEMKKDMG